MDLHVFRSAGTKPVSAMPCDFAGGTCPYPTCEHGHPQAEIEARRDERSRMGRELHDSTAQTLVALQLKVLYLKNMFDEPRYHELLGEVQDTINELHEEIRAVSYFSNLPLLEQGMLPAALSIMAARFGKLTGLEITFCTTGTYACAPRDAELSLYRIAQEALANAFRHAHATMVRMSLEASQRQLRLVIIDDGVGVEHDMLELAGGVGLENVRARVRDLNGRFSFRQTGQGSRFMVTIPLHAVANDASKFEAMMTR